jgi:hypothetical protein
MRASRLAASVALASLLACVLETFTLEVTAEGAGAGVVTSAPAGIECGATCAHEFTKGTTVTLTAAPQPGSAFAGWSGGGCTGTGPCVVRMKEDVRVTARWSIAQPADSWRAVAPMAEPRAYHTATVLPSGKVLVAGGRSGATALASAVLFDPLTEQWSATSPMSIARGEPRATLLATGKVLVTGGDGSAELYDPTTGTWAPTGSMTRSDVHGHTATLLPSGMVLVAGGGRDPLRPPGWSPLAELYDPQTGTWSRTGEMMVGRAHHSATLLTSGKVLVVGGLTGDSDVMQDGENGELYDPASGTWASAGTSSGPSAWHTATLLNTGAVAVVGGSVANAFPAFVRDAIDLYTPDVGWSAGQMLTGRVDHSATLLPSGRVLIAGGRSGPVGASEIGPPVHSAEFYGPAGQDVAHPMTTARAAHAAVLLPSGDVLVIGGEDESRDPLASAEIYRE